MTKFNELVKGNILGESQYYTVEKKSGDRIQLKTDSGESIVVSKDYVESFLNSADQFSETEKVTKTQLADLFINNPRIVMTVTFLKANKTKTKKAYKEELMQRSEEIKNEFLSSGISAIEKALQNPVLDYIPGELRVMRGRHYGELDDLGRMHFTDMEATDGRKRQVDPRTIQNLVVNNKKYVLK